MGDIATYLFSQIKLFGVDYIFGIPGDELKIFDALAHSDIEFVTTRHEQAAAFMAQAVGKLSPLPGFCISTLGPGAANLVTGVADAYQNRAPIIVLSGQLETYNQSTKPQTHQYIDLQKLFAPVTKATLIIKTANDVKSVLKEAITIATSPRKGPVHISLPIDVMEEQIGERQNNNYLKITSSITSLNKTAINKASKIIKASKYPVLFFGQQAQYLPDDARRNVTKMNIPTITSFLGKGSFDETSALSLGTVSRHVKDKLKDVLDKADLFIVVGYDYIEGVHPSIFQEKEIVYIDTISPAEEKIIKSTVSLVGDIWENTDALFKSLENLNYKSKWLLSFIKGIRHARYQQVLDAQELKSFPLNPFFVMQAVQKAMAGDEHIVSDVGNHKQAVGLGFRAKRPLTIHFSNGLSTMGFSLPFAAGIRFAKGTKDKILVICGDGGFLMNVQELETIKRYNLNIKIIIFVDNAFGMIKSNLLAKYQRVKNLDFSNPDFKYLAKSFGIEHISVKGKQDIQTKLKKLLGAKHTTLMTIPIKYS